MPSSPVIKVVEHLRKTMLRPEEDRLSDGQLLDRFLEKRDEVAFAALVRRHGPMVWGVCRRIVGHAHDAEDAFQAAFLILVRKAAAVKPRAAVGNWLYGVACHAALKARTASARVRSKEKQVTSMPEPAKDLRHDREELQILLDQELSALPDKYRLPVVLCDLEGRTRKAVAAQLKIPEGTLSSRLATAHQKLAKRLARHGLAVSGGSLATLFAQNAASACVPAAVVSSTIKTATLVAASDGAVVGVVSTKVAALTEGVLKAMLLTKLKTMTAVLALLGMLALGGGLLTYHTAAGQEGQTEKSPAQGRKIEADNRKKEAPKSDKQRIQGTWEVVSMEQDGMKLLIGKEDEEKLAVFDGDKWTTKAEQGQEGKGLVFKLDATKKPKSIDLTASDGKTVLGIYELQGNDLKICLSTAEVTKRPTEIATNFGSRTMLWVLKRKAKKTDAPDEGKGERAKVREQTKVDEYADAVKKDLERFQGTWEILSFEIPGGKMDLPEDKTHRTLTIEGNKATLRIRKQEIVMTWLIDPSKNPKRLDICYEHRSVEGKIEKGVFDGKVGPAIYELEGDSLKECSDDPGEQRPAEFSTPRTTKRSLLILKRMKP